MSRRINWPRPAPGRAAAVCPGETPVVATLFLALAVAAGPDVQVVLVADTDDRKIGESCLADLQNLRALLAPPNWPRGTTVEAAEFVGTRNAPAPAAWAAKALPFDGDRLRQHLNEMALAPNKTRVVIWYCGHGSFTAADGHRLTMRPAVADEALIRVLQARAEGLPLVALIADSCATGVRERSDAPAPAPAGRAAANVAAKLDRLILQARGVVHVNSSAEGTQAFGGDRGGYFTSALCDYLGDAKVAPTASWRAALTVVGRQTNESFLKGVDWSRKNGFRTPAQTSQEPQPYCLPERDDAVDPPSPFGRLGVGFEKAPGTAAGVRVETVEPGTPAAGKLAAGDRVTAINGKRVRSYREVYAVLDFFAPDAAVRVAYTRDGAPHTAEIVRPAAR